MRRQEQKIVEHLPLKSDGMTVNCGHKREKSVVAKRWRVRIVPREAEETTVGSGFS